MLKGFDPADEEEEDAPVLARRRMRSETSMDMTPMIDCTFLLLIFFTVGAKFEPDTAIDLPPAQYGRGVDPHNSVIVSVAKKDDKGEGLIYLASGKIGSPLEGSLDEQASVIREAVQAGKDQGKMHVLIKAERDVLHREVARVAAAAAQVEGMELDVAIMESD